LAAGPSPLIAQAEMKKIQIKVQDPVLQKKCWPATINYKLKKLTLHLQDKKLIHLYIECRFLKKKFTFKVEKITYFMKVVDILNLSAELYTERRKVKSD